LFIDVAVAVDVIAIIAASVAEGIESNRIESNQMLCRTLYSSVVCI
jgi:hypothetical protein